MRVVSRLLIAAAFAALPRLMPAQGVAPADAGFRTEVTLPVTVQYVAPEGTQSQTADPASAAATEPDQAADDDAGGAGRVARGAGPSLVAATAGIRANTAKEDLTAQEAARRAAHHGGLGPGGALMIVGAAAFIAGLIIGGGAGTAVAIAGAAVGLYGLYLFLQ
jgi:hypothetical protein